MVSSVPTLSSSAESAERGKLREIYIQPIGQDHESQTLTHDIQHELGIEGVTAEICSKYYVQGDDENGLTDEEFELARKTIFAQLPLERTLDKNEFYNYAGKSEIIDVADVPGQFSARTDAVEMSLLAQTGRNFTGKAKSNQVVILRGNITDEQRKKIQKYIINPVEKVEQEAGDPIFPDAEKSPESYRIMDECALVTFDDKGKNPSIRGYKPFIELPIVEFKNFALFEGISIDVDDLTEIQTYFRDVEKRNPTYTELKVIETYWSDHCRHTTFHTAIQSVEISGDAPQIVQDMQTSQKMFEDTLGEGGEITLMKLAQAGYNTLKNDPAFLKHRELYNSEENNACSIVIEVVNELGKTEKMVIMFKNETHNHPTEIEPFGGAATCLGGCIRDPLSGGTYTYQAMRISGSGDPTQPLSTTMDGKLSQRYLSHVSSKGFSSYGNQIGLATGLVRELFHPGFVAKHLDMGVVVAAAPLEHNKRSKPKKGDIVLMIGGRTGRDGMGGASASSGEQGTHLDQAKAAASVQKGNPTEERKLQRLFRDPIFAGMVIKCNDFGAGGVAVAVGEVAEGLDINLDTVRTKYSGLSPDEIAISESQERMAVVINPDNYEAALAQIHAENLECVQVAVVTDDEESPANNRLKMNWKGHAVVDISRAFLNSNGAKKTQDRVIPKGNKTDFFLKNPEELAEFLEAKEKFLANLGRLGVASQKGLGSNFDSSVGGGTVDAPYGGKYQMSPEVGMAAKVPSFDDVDGLDWKTATIVTSGGFPYLSDENPYLGGMYAIIDAISRTVAMGGDIEKVWLTAQEYFGKIGKDETRWGMIYGALLGFYRAQIEIKSAAIGGKDSASGTFKKGDGESMHVPTTLLAVALTPQDSDKIVSAAFQDDRDRKVLYFPFPRDADGLPDWGKYREMLEDVSGLHSSGGVRAATVVEQGGTAAAVAKMCFGNRIGFVAREELEFSHDMGGIILEITDKAQIPESAVWLGNTSRLKSIIFPDASTGVSLEEAQNAWEHTFDSVHSIELSGGPVEPIPPHIPEKPQQRPIILDAYGNVTSSETRNKVNIITKSPKVVIPVFPGTNSELDTKHALHKAGFTDVEVFVFQTKTPEELEDSFKRFAKLIGESHLVFFAGGFSGSDEPGGSAKFINVILRSARVRDAINGFLQRQNTLTGGICNGFQALLKLGVFENGEISDFQTELDMTLAHNTNGRHMTDLVGLKVTSVLSPFLNTVDIGDTFIVPISHAEGCVKFSSEAQFLELLAKGQIVLQYLDADGKPTNEYNGSDHGVAGICSSDGRVFGLMPHPERSGPKVYKNIPGNKHFGIFDGAAAAYGIKPKYQRSKDGSILMPTVE